MVAIVMNVTQFSENRLKDFRAGYKAIAIIPFRVNNICANRSE